MMDNAVQLLKKKFFDLTVSRFIFQDGSSKVIALCLVILCFELWCPEEHEQ